MEVFENGSPAIAIMITQNCNLTMLGNMWGKCDGQWEGGL